MSGPLVKQRSNAWIPGGSGGTFALTETLVNVTQQQVITVVMSAVNLRGLRLTSTNQGGGSPTLTLSLTGPTLSNALSVSATPSVTGGGDCQTSHLRLQSTAALPVGTYVAAAKITGLDIAMEIQSVYIVVTGSA